MAWRESFYVEPMTHLSPIPTATRVGNIVYTGIILGRDLETGEVPDAVEEQAANVFAILARILERVGGSTEHVAQVEVKVAQADNRNHVNKVWQEIFPEEASRPVQHVVIDASMRLPVAITAIAVLPN